MSEVLLPFERAIKDHYKKCKNKSCENCVYTCKEDKHWYCNDWEYEGRNNPVWDIICDTCTKKNCFYYT